MKLTMNTKWDEKKRPYSWEMIDFGYERCKPKPEVLASCTLEVAHRFQRQFTVRFWVKHQNGLGSTLLA